MAVSDRQIVDELCQYLDGTVESMLLLCEEFLGMLCPHFNFKFPDFDHVVFDIHDRCHNQYFREHQIMESYLSLNHDWSFSDCCDLVEEVLAIVDQEIDMGVTKYYPIRQGGKTLGLTLGWFRDRIFVQCGGCRHPFYLVATTLHELGHQMVWRTPHTLACVGENAGHCIVWQRCT